nr:uncharacterized protein LOC113827629 isoform X1 [Penaeus vannamei]
MVESKAPSPPASTGSGEWRHHRKSGWASPMVAFRLQFAARCEREGIPPRFTLDFYGYLFSLSTDSLFSVPSAIPKAQPQNTKCFPSTNPRCIGQPQAAASAKPNPAGMCIFSLNIVWF